MPTAHLITFHRIANGNPTTYFYDFLLFILQSIITKLLEKSQLIGNLHLHELAIWTGLEYSWMFIGSNQKSKLEITNSVIETFHVSKDLQSFSPF